jgi:uncharacterized protein (TIGR02145 family)
MKSRLLLIALLASFTSFGQVLDYDGNGDGCVNVDDMLGLLIEYGQCLGEQEEFMCGDNINHEGYNYSTVQIGEQCWFSENCRYLTNVSPPNEDDTIAPKYYVYGYYGIDVEEAKTTLNYETFGVLYNWPAVITEEICPSGWHIPSDSEWQTMEVALGMSESDAASTSFRGAPVGDYMKSTSGWNSEGNGSNSSGFNGIPGGFRGDWSNDFEGLGNYGYWWASSEDNIQASWYRLLYKQTDDGYRGSYWNEGGFSARCLKD